MPEPSARLAPMPPLPGAVPGVEPLVPLTPIATPQAARAALAAEVDTTVAGPPGMRRLWVREVNLAVTVVLLVVMVAVAVAYLTGDLESPLEWSTLVLVLSVVSTGTTHLPAALCRVLPERGAIPKSVPARWRWYRQLAREPVVATAPAAWPRGAEAYALLSGAAGVASVTPRWLCERVGLPPDVGEAWVASLRWRGWLAGGGRFLGLDSMPELHLQVTPAGRVVLDGERARLAALAAS